MSTHSPAPLASGLMSGDIDELTGSFMRYLRATNARERTLEAYGQSISQLSAFLHTSGMSTEGAQIKREHMEIWINYLLSRWKASTASTRYRAAQSFFEYLAEEGEVRDSPMKNMKPHDT